LNDNGTLIFIGIAAAVFGAAAYYLKVLRPKRHNDAPDDEEEF
jgi:hypothetical protein